MTKVVQFMSRRLYDHGVEVKLNTTVTKEMLETEYKDYEVIAATGAKANIIPAFTGFKDWMTADDILAGRSHLVLRMMDKGIGIVKRCRCNILSGR